MIGADDIRYSMRAADLPEEAKAALVYAALTMVMQGGLFDQNVPPKTRNAKGELTSEGIKNDLARYAAATLQRWLDEHYKPEGAR